MPPLDLGALQSAVAGRLDEFLADLRVLSGIDCGTHNKAGVNQVAAWVLARCAGNGWATRVHARQSGGDIVEARTGAGAPKRILILSHMDTVYPDGVAADRPMRIDGNRIVGPGTADMKAGLLAGIYAVEVLSTLLNPLPAEIVLLFTADEEIGAPESRELIEATAKTCDAALVLEAARASGAIVGARKGITTYRLDVQGRSAHAGVEPEKGRNALLELAHTIVALQALNGTVPGATLNVGLAGGGTALNVVPDSAWARFEARAFTPDALAQIDARIHAVAGTRSLPDTFASLTAYPGHPPMPRTAQTEGLIAMARGVAHELGFEVEAVSTGGASDACIVASAGIPVLDGLGPIGGDDHSPSEWVALDSIVPRVALLAGLIARIADEPN